MDKKEFLTLCENNDYSKINLGLISEAYDFAEENLKEKKRISGSSFFDHNLGVAIILIDIKSSPEIVLAGLLHGIDKLTEIKSKFGEEVYSLIKGLTEIENLKHKNQKLQAETLRKIILTTIEDVRVIFLKLANKLDNLQSLEVLKPDEQKRIAQETLDIYAPLAYRLGLDKIKVKLENLAFKHLYTKKYNQISNFLKETQEERDEGIQRAIEQIKDLCKNKIKILKIKGRSKHIYSIYKKIKFRKIKLNEQYDLLGIRVIVPEDQDCYSLLGILHENFEPVEECLKDYIAKPKPNFYRSIHTCVKLPNGTRLEVQIRTPEMEELAEEGIAAHWRYKGISSEQIFEKKVAWLKGILDLQKEENNKEFLETAKVDIFGDSIYCYTPKGDVKELPKNATILDFAYLVHEQVGNHAVGGKVNGKFVPIKHKLVKGDVVEIVTNKNQRPRRGWIKIVVSSKSRQKIRKSLRLYETLPDFHFRKFKPAVREEQSLLLESLEFPKASCILAKCCNALPGEEIIGFFTKKRIISVHKIDCKQAIKEEERWVPVTWKETFNQKIRFFIKAHERSGLLADLLNTIARAGFEVKEAKAKLIDLGHAECNFLVIPKSLDHLKELVIRIQKVKGITAIYFE